MSYRSRLRPVKRAAAAILHRSWGIGFRIAAHVSVQRAPRLLIRGGDQVLILAPHPDDEAIGCAGAAMLHTEGDDRVCLVVATDGRRSRAIPDPARMALLRHAEAKQAARLMQVDRLVWFGLPEGAWQLPDLALRLQRLLEEINPAIIYAPSRLDFHPEHLAVAQALALALEVTTEQSLRVRIYGSQVPVTALLANCVADVSVLQGRCEAVLHAYPTQAASVACAFRQRRYIAQRHGIATAAEEFWEMPAAQYVRLHRTAPAVHATGFRGLRNFPLSDPLAYLVGRQQRRALRRQLS